jgi:hypothetical protein
VAAPSAPKTGYLFTDRRDGKHKHSAHSPTFTDHGAKYHTVAADTTTVFSRSAPRDFSPSQSYQNHATQKKKKITISYYNAPPKICVDIYWK